MPLAWVLNLGPPQPALLATRVSDALAAAESGLFGYLLTAAVRVAPRRAASRRRAAAKNG